MKILRSILLSILAIFAAVSVMLYLAFLFVLPYSVDLNEYSPKITQMIQDNTGFQVNLEGLKIKTAWNLSAGASIKKVDLKYSSGEKFAQINNLQINLSLIPLLFKEVQVDKINAEKILANINVNNKETTKPPMLNSKPSSFKYSKNMPDILVKKYRVSFIKGKNKYSIKGTDLKISDFVLNEKIKVKSNGELILNEKNQISYNISVFSNVFPEKKKESFEFIKIFEDLYKYNIKAKIETDLRIRDQSNIDGKINLNKISFTFGNKTYPQSTLKLAFHGDKAKINSSLHVDKNSKIIISGFFKNGKNKGNVKNKAIDLQVISDAINIKDIILITKAMSKPFGLNNIENIDADGFLKANFKVKSDFKKIESAGYLSIKNASIKKLSENILLNQINADVDFSQNSIKIKKAGAKLNNQPITISGTIGGTANKIAVADILITANNLPLKGVLFSAGGSKILKENDILSGEVTVKAYLKGRLDKAFPQVNIIVNNLGIKNKKSKTIIKATKATIYSINSSNKNLKNKNKDNYLADITALKIYPPSSSLLSIPKFNLAFNKQELNIKPTYLYINNFRTNLSGKISNLDSKPYINSLLISVPNQVSFPIKGYANSSITLKGTVTINGDLNNPKTQGEIVIPLINIPYVPNSGAPVILRNTTVQINKNININCPQGHIANSLISFNAQLDKDLTNGIVAQNVIFDSDVIDLNSLIPVFKTLTKNAISKNGGKSTLKLAIIKGKSTVSNFKVAKIVSKNISSNLSLKNNVLYLDDLRGDAYIGKIAGDISYDLNKHKTSLNLQGRGLSANSALTGLMGRNDDINGQLDFDSNVSITGYTKNELLRSLKGYTNFIISDGKMGALGKFEHLLYAQNVVSNSVFKATLNLMAKALTVKNTGVYKYMKGKIAFSDGWANIDWVKTSGPSMSLYLTGRYYLPNNTANLTILGRISDDVVRILGPIGEFSMNKAISSIPKIGEINAFFASQFTTSPNYENISQIPPLTPKTEFKTKEFKVVIDGDVQKQSSVKSFKWLARPKIVQSSNQPSSLTPQVSSGYTTTIQTPSYKEVNQELPDFVKKLPDLKN